MKLAVLLLVLMTILVGSIGCSGDRPAIVLATTTSTHDTGLLDALLPEFEKATGRTVKAVAVGTGQALEMGRRGQADVLLVHAPKKEIEFVDKGFGRNRLPVMHNDFVVVGPRSDPAGVKGVDDVSLALRRLAEKGAIWISRGDGSGTHTKETELLRGAGIEPGEEWFLESGQGMGATLRIAGERRAYALSDRGTFLAAEGIELVVLVEGDTRLHNPYHVIEVVGPEVDAAGASSLANFLRATETQRLIGGFERNGQRLFTPEVVTKTP